MKTKDGRLAIAPYARMTMVRVVKKTKNKLMTLKNYLFTNQNFQCHRQVSIELHMKEIRIFFLSYYFQKDVRFRKNKLRNNIKLDFSGRQNKRQLTYKRQNVID